MLLSYGLYLFRKKPTNIIVLFIFIFILNGCDNSPHDDVQNVTTVKTIEGNVYYDENISSTINLYSIYDLNNPIYSTTISKTGKFKIENIEIDKSKLYIITICFNLEGKCFNAIAKGKDISMHTIHIGYLHDMIFTSLNKAFLTKPIDEIEDFLNKKAKEYCKEDLNNDGEINYTDILLFNPTEYISKLNIDYNLIKNMYGAQSQDKITIFEKLKLLLLLDKPQLKFNSGSQISLNDIVNITVDNLPYNVESKLFFNGTEITNKYQPIIIGVNNIYSKLFFNGKEIGEISKPIIRSSQNQLAKFETKITENSSFKIDYNSSISLGGLEINIPKNSLTTSKTISIKENDISIIASSRGRTLSSVLILEPSGTEFNSPVMIKMPFSGNLEKHDIEKVEIARYSKDSGLDYIKPLYIDITNKFIYFETDHFSWFSAKGPFSSKSSIERKKEVDYLNNLTGKNWLESRWKIILDPDNEEEYTLYDNFLETYLSEQIYNKVENSDFVGASKVLIYDNDALDETVERWNRAKLSLMALQTLLGKKVKISDDKWWKFWAVWSDTSKIHTMMGLSQDFILDTENIAYTPFSPVKMGDKLFGDFEALLKNDLIMNAFIQADLDGGWNTVYIKPNFNSPDTENNYNKNIGLVYRKYDEFRKYGLAHKETLKNLIHERSTFIDNMKDPYLRVYLDRVGNHSFTKFGEGIEIQLPESIQMKVRVDGLGIINFDESDLKYELIGNFGGINQFILNKDITKNELYFNLPDEEMFQSYSLIITHVPTSIYYQQVGINIITKKQTKFNLISSSLISDSSVIYPNDPITLIFDDDIDEESINKYIYLENKNTKEKSTPFWIFETKNCKESLDTFSRDECDTDFSILKYFPIIDNNQYELVIEDALESMSGKTLSKNYVSNIDMVHPNAFEIHRDRTQNNGSSINLYFKIFSKYDATKLKYTVKVSSGKEVSGSLDIGSASHGGPMHIGHGPCETYVNVSPYSGIYKDEVVNYNILEVMVGNSRNVAINETVSIKFCDENEECKITDHSIQLKAINAECM